MSHRLLPIQQNQMLSVEILIFLTSVNVKPVVPQHFKKETNYTKYITNNLTSLFSIVRHFINSCVSFLRLSITKRVTK